MLSFRVRTVAKIRRKRPDLRTVLNLGRRPDLAVASGFWGVGLEDGTASPQVVARARSLGLATTVFTVNDPARMRELADLGVTGIFTDRPAVLREALVHLGG
jgi:glycerophosphoryl diester phosphodiesterase